MPGRPDPTLSAICRELLSSFSEAWGSSDLANSTTVTVSERLYRSLARVNPRTREIRLAAPVALARREALAEVLCHEAAHIAAFERHGQSIRPHGKEWSDLMCAAGFTPNVRIDATDLGISLPRPPKRRSAPRYRYEHRCPVCHERRVAGRVVREWRCSACTEAGLSGELVITRSRRPTSRTGAHSEGAR